MPSLRDALEAALVEDPDDLATHRAYADYLQEQGDPRGEFIQVQLALEDPERIAEERRQLQTRERELLAEHGRKWLGILADELLGPEDESWEESDRQYEIRFVRGWLDRIAPTSTGKRFTNLGKLLAEAPESRLLRELILLYDIRGVEQLARSPFVSNLRMLRIGQQGLFTCEIGSGPTLPLSWCETLPSFVAKLPRIEELHLCAQG